MSRRYPARHWLQAGFSLVELSMVMVVIGLLYGAVVMGSDMIRVARGQRIVADFVLPWTSSFRLFVSQTGQLPGDNPQNPTNLIAGGGVLCDAALGNAFLSRGVQIPEAPASGEEDRRTYQDSHGIPHVLRVCMRTSAWSAPGTSVGSYQVVQRHTLWLQGLTVELAEQIDSMLDGHADARFGHLRSVALAASTGTAPAPWPATVVGPQDQQPEVEALLDMGSN